MTDMDRWLSGNDQHLAAMLDWLRRRLERLAGTERPVPVVTRNVPQSTARASAGKPRSLRDRIFSSPALPHARDDVPNTAVPPSEPIPLPAPQNGVEAAEGPPALTVLGERLGLSEFERHTLFLCAAMELDARMGSLCANAQQDLARSHPTFALALTLFDQPAWDVLSPERPLRYWRLVEINQPGAQPLINSALKADERIVNYIKGLNYLDDRLAPLVMPVPRSEVPLPPSQAGIVDVITRHLGRVSE